MQNRSNRWQMTTKSIRHQFRYWLIVLSTVLISYSVLTFEITLTRVFSVMLSYHYVFAIISFALFGLGIGGMSLQKLRRLLPMGRRLRSESLYPTNALLFAVLIAGSVIVIIKLPILGTDILAGFGFWLFLLLVTLPFFFAGLTLAEIFERFAEQSSILYGADLLGATLGALTVVPLLNALGGVNAAFATAVVAALGALILGFSEAKFPVFNLASTVVLGLGISLIYVFGGVGEVPIARNPDKDMYSILKNPEAGAEIVESRWRAFGRTDLVRSPLLPNEMILYVDGAAGSSMYNLNALLQDPSQRVHITAHFGEFFPFLFLEENEKDNALIIGPGGGRDVVVALLGEVKSITAVEVNPEVVQIVKDYEDFNGGIYTSLPNVKVVVGEGRNYLRTAGTKYDLILLALPITKSSRSVEGYALTENYLFTVEALGDYLDHLTPEGRIVIVAHGDPEIYRLIVLAIKAFENQNITPPDAMKRIYTLASSMPTIVIKNQPFEESEIVKRHEAIHKLGYDRGNFFVPYIRQITIRPDERLGIDQEWRMFDQILVDISSGQLTIEQLIGAATFEIGPVTDDSPFFYKFKPGLPNPFGTFSILIVLALGGLIALIAIPKGSKTSQNSFVKSLAGTPQLKIFLLIFFSLGAGFMLIEIAFFQKLTLFIGQPLLALTVLLFSLLLGTGVGSFASALARKRLERVVTIAALTVSLLTIVYTLSAAWIFRLGFDPKLTATLLLLPIGFVLGFPFPISIRLMKRYGLEGRIHLMWGINGIASVLGSALAMIIGILIGFSYAIYLGAILYVGVAVFSVLLHRFKIPSEPILHKPN